MKEKICFIGFGVMGAPMAGHLACAGYAVTAYSRTHAKVELWLTENQAYEVSSASSLDKAVADADIIISCVGNDHDLMGLAQGDHGIVKSAKEGAIWLDHTTSSAKIARELYQAMRERGQHFIDAPISGGQSGAENGCLTVMAGGEADIFNRLEAVLACYSKSATLIGPSGAGQLTKMVNQICLAGTIQGLSEGIHFAQQAGLDAEKVIAAIQHGAAQSWQMDNRAETMIADHFEYGFAVDLMRKDLGICLDQARAMQTGLPVAALVDQFYADVQSMGGNRWDTSSLIKRLK